MSVNIVTWVSDGNPYSSINLQAQMLRTLLESGGCSVTVVHPSDKGVVRAYRSAIRADWIIWNFYSFDVWLLPLLMRRRVIVVYHNITPAKYFALSQPLVALRAICGRIQLWLLPRTWRYVAVSQFNSTELIRAGKRRVDVVPCFVSRPARSESPKALIPTIIFAGRIVENKNCLFLLDQVAIAARVLERPIQLVVVGAGNPNRSYYKQFAKRVSCLSGHSFLNVRWIDRGVDQNLLDGLYEEAWLYASASRHEGFGLPVCEAIARGTPAVYLPCGGTEVVLNGEGLVAGEGDLLAAEVVRCIADPEYLGALLSRQKGIVERYLIPGPNANEAQATFSRILK